MSYLDGLFVQTTTELEIATAEVTESRQLDPGFLYQVAMGADDIFVELTSDSIADVAGLRIALKVVSSAPSPGGLRMSVPSPMEIEDDAGEFGLFSEIASDSMLGVYREWLCDANGRWMLLAGTGIGGGGGGGLAIAKDGVEIASRPTLNFADSAGTNSSVEVVDDAESDRVDVTVHATMAVQGPSGPLIEQPVLRLINGANVAISMADDVINGEIEATVAAKASVTKASVAIGTRTKINLIQGTGITLSVVDNPGTDSVDITISLT